MRRLYHFFALATILLASCATDEVDYVGGGDVKPSANDGIHIFGAVEDFDNKSVRTRADGDQPADSHISEMTMFVFDKNGNIVQGYLKRTVTAVDADGNPTEVTFNDIDKTTSVINIAKANPTFLIDTKAGIIASLDDASPSVIYYDHVGDTNDLTECKIYIVANAWHALEDRVNNITSIEILEQYTIPIDGTLAMPKMDDNTMHRGFPMIGTHAGQTFDLRYEGSNAGAVAKIPLKKLYSKVNFTMQVNATQVVAGQTPKFEIEKVEVFNVPTMARLGRDLDSNGKPIYGTTDADDYINEIAGGSITADNLATYYQYTDTSLSEEGKFTITDFNKKTIYHSASSTTDDVIKFGFYMPEHKVTPNAITYPSGIDDDDDLKQYFKPLGVGAVRNEDGTTDAAKIATYVRIHGTYTDHNGQIKDVRYDIYLGQNNTDDFTVKRNQLLNNRLVITGLTNYYDAYGDVDGNISIDHRVDVDYKGFNLSMERTAILDSHFEVRPLDVELSPGSYMVVTIPEEYRSWVAMESDAKARETEDADTYVDIDTERRGVRKYFTTNLVSELTEANGGTIELTHSGNSSNAEIYRIWFYIDENPNVYDKLGKGAQTDESGYTVGTDLYRICPVKFQYAGSDYDNTSGNATTVSKTVYINFQQWNLWRVWSADGKRYYDIEHEEEYLNNYASDEAYGGTQQGMPWGLEGIQLSNSVNAYWSQKVENGLFAEIIDAIFNTSGDANNIFAKSGKNPYYDFYLTRDNYPVANMPEGAIEADYKRDYKGIEFNEEIATTLKASSDPNAKIDGITLTEDPQSAFAYCYHKNKRNSNGEVVEQKWFLPAIDEIEDIALGAYDEFDKVFQNQMYWSCQPAYNYNTLQIVGMNYVGTKVPDWLGGGWTGYYVATESMGGKLTGAFYEDNKSRARATLVYSNGVTYANVQSGLPSDEISGHLDATAYKDGPKDGTAETSFSDKNIDYNVDIYITGEYRGNRSRTDICRIRAVYRSGSIE